MTDKTKITDVPTWQLREAAKAWRKSDAGVGLWGGSKNISLHDKIDDMVDEIDRLRVEIAGARK